MKDERDRMLRPDEAAEIIGSDAKTMSNWRHLGRGPKFVKEGKFIRYWLSEIMRWAKSREVDPAA